MNVKIVFPPSTYFDSASIQIGHMISILKEECEIHKVNYRDYKSEKFYMYDRLVSSVINHYWEDMSETAPHLLRDEMRALVHRAVVERTMGINNGTEHAFTLNPSLIDELEKVYRSILESMLINIDVHSSDVIIFVPPYYITESTYLMAKLAKEKDPDICIMVFDYYNLQPGTPYITAFLTDSNFYGEDVSPLLQLDPLYLVLKGQIPRFFDFIVVGEGYDVLRAMFRSHTVQDHETPAVEYHFEGSPSSSTLTEPPRLRDSVFVTQSHEVPLDSLPLPDYREMREVHPQGQIELTRGCPYQCLFCETSPALNFRKHSVRYLRELLDHIRQYKFEYLCFWDPALNIDCEHSTKALKEVRDNDLMTCAYTAQLRAQPGDPQLIALLRETGCDLAGIGMESACQGRIDDMDKKYEVENLETLVELLGKNGIGSLLYTLIAYPTEHFEDVQETVSFIRKASSLCKVDITLEPYGIGLVQRLSFSKFRDHGIECLKPTPQTMKEAAVLQTSPGIYSAIQYKKGMNREEYHRGIQLYRELAEEIGSKAIIPG